MAIYENIKLDKGLYETSKGFLAELESVDPSKNYNGTELEGLDAFERQLKRFDIKISGAGSDTIEKFFQTSDSAVLFPEYFARAVKRGTEENNTVKDIIATRTEIDGLDYRTGSSTFTTLQQSKSIVDIPAAHVKMKNNLVRLHKRGKMLVASYEALRFQRLDLFTVTLKQIGAYIAKSQLNDAVNTIVFGDGNNNPAESFIINKLMFTYDELVSFWSGFDPYRLNTIIASPDAGTRILRMPEMRDTNTSLNLYGTNKIITPLGANLIISNAVKDGLIVGLDKTCTLEMVQVGGIMTEYNKLIDRQLERAAITEISGFAKIFTDASKALRVC